jgi:hypothetical protein
MRGRDRWHLHQIAGKSFNEISALVVPSLVTAARKVRPDGRTVVYLAPDIADAVETFRRSGDLKKPEATRALIRRGLRITASRQVAHEGRTIRPPRQQVVVEESDEGGHGSMSSLARFSTRIPTRRSGKFSGVDLRS